MQVGMTLPVMEPGLDAAVLERWSRYVDDAASYSSVCFGERVAFDNPDAVTLLGAVAAWTSRVRIATTVLVPQLHEPVRLAKALATADLISGGRVSVGVGVGGREEDYRAAGADPATKTIAAMAERVAVMREVWGGVTFGNAVRPVGPAPLQAGGPEILVGTMGPKTVRHAAAWADGLAGVTLDLDVTGVGRLFDLARKAWAEHGRPVPRLTTSFWFAVGEEPRDQIHRHLRHYMNWLPPDLVDALAENAGFAGTPEQLRDVLRRFEDLGADEVQLIPTSVDLAQVERVAEVLDA